MHSSNLTTLLTLVILGLIGALGYLAKNRPVTAPPIIQIITNAPAPIVVREEVPVVHTNDFRWTQLESEDYPTYIARLRAIGCPEQTIRDIIIADIDKLFAAQIQSQHPAPDLNYWEPDPKTFESNQAQRERLRQQRAVDFQKRAILQSLMGIDLVAERSQVQGLQDPVGRRLAFLPDDKRSEVRLIVDKYNDQEMAIREKIWEEGETLSSEDFAQLREIHQARDQEIRQILTASEFAHFELQVSPTAYQIRQSLAGLNPTEQEFLKIFQLRKPFDQKWAFFDPAAADPHARGLWQQDKFELDAQLRLQLGPHRFTEYQRAQDPDFRFLKIAATQYEIPEDVVSVVYEFKQAAQKQRDFIKTDPFMTEEQKSGALEEIAAETEQSVRELLGDKPFRFLHRQGAADWVRQ